MSLYKPWKIASKKKCRQAAPITQVQGGSANGDCPSPILKRHPNRSTLSSGTPEIPITIRTRRNGRTNQPLNSQWLACAQQSPHSLPKSDRQMKPLITPTKLSARPVQDPRHLSLSYPIRLLGNLPRFQQALSLVV
jgi:hypothetical protein